MQQLSSRVVGFMPAAVVLVLLLSALWPYRLVSRPVGPRRRASEAPWIAGWLLAAAASLLSGVGVDMWYASSTSDGYFQGALLVGSLACIFVTPLWTVAVLSFRWAERVASRREEHQ